MLHYFGQHCVPSAAGSRFTSGNLCEPECWTQGGCGDGTDQGDLVGLCGGVAAADDRSLLLLPVDSTSNSSSTTTTTLSVTATNATT